MLAGINNFVFGDSAATAVSRLEAYCDARRAAGWKVVVCTLTPDTQDAGGNTFRNAVNALIYAWSPGAHADAIADFAADPTMGPDAAANDTTLYSDGIHPTLYGHSILANVAAKAIATRAI